jgi:hypothetical protein
MPIHGVVLKIRWPQGLTLSHQRIQTEAFRFCVRFSRLNFIFICHFRCMCHAPVDLSKSRIMCNYALLISFQRIRSTPKPVLISRFCCYNYRFVCCAASTQEDSRIAVIKLNFWKYAFYISVFFVDVRYIEIIFITSFLNILLVVTLTGEGRVWSGTGKSVMIVVFNKIRFVLAAR